MTAGNLKRRKNIQGKKSGTRSTRAIEKGGTTSLGLDRADLERYTLKDRLIHARIGEEFKIRFRDNEEGGYEWTVQQPDSVLELVREEYKAPGIRNDGTSEKLVTFRAVEPGRVNIRAEHRKAWEVMPIDSHNFEVEVSLRP